MTTVTQPAQQSNLSPTLQASTQDGDDVVTALSSDASRGLSAGEVEARLRTYGPNAVASHRARWLSVLWHQLRSPLLGLLLAAALVSAFFGERNDAVIIAIIVAVSVGLGFFNEYRAARAAEALHSQIHHETEVVRNGTVSTVDVTALVPGDLVRIHLGDIVPADVRLLVAEDLECEESVLTGEALAVTKDLNPVPAGTALADLTCCALMGTVVHAGRATGVVVATGARTEFGAIAAGVSTHQLDTQFQIGLRRFSMLLVYVAAILTTAIFIINLILQRPLLDALLFSLAIAVGITPQLLPAVVSTSLAAGSRRMSRRKVLVKRLVCIEDLGDVDVLFTDKTGTLTLGEISFLRAVPATTGSDDAVLRWGLLGTETWEDRSDGPGRDALDHALWQASRTVVDLSDSTQRGVRPFDHERRLVSVLVQDSAGALTVVVKGAPETVLDRCVSVGDDVRATVSTEFARGSRVVAVATRSVGSGRRKRGRPSWRMSTDSPWPDCSCSPTHRDPKRQPRCDVWGRSASRSRSSPATTAQWPSACAATWGWPASARSPVRSSTHWTTSSCTPSSRPRSSSRG